MYELCENFLKTCDPTHVETHSDSSDFENMNITPIVSPRHGNHSLFMDQSCLIKPEKNINSCSSTCDTNKLRVKRYRKKLSSMNHNDYVSKHQSNHINVITKNYNKNRGNQSSIHLIQKSYSKSIIRNKVMPCLSTIFRRSHNCTKHMECIEEDRANNTNNCDRYCLHPKFQRSSKNTRRSRGDSVQPVYAMNGNFHGFRYPNTIQQVSATKVKCIRNEDYDISFDNNSIYSVSDCEINSKAKQKNIVKEVKQRLEKEMKYYNYKQAQPINKQQQFPSKSQLKSPLQTLISCACQAKCTSFESNGLKTLPSSSSAFWDFLAGKIKFPVEKAKVEKAEVVKPCRGTQPFSPCSPVTCEYKVSKDGLNVLKQSVLSKLPSCCKLREKESRKLGQKESSELGEKEPSKLGEKEPSKLGEKEPSKLAEKEPSKLGEKEPSNLGQKQSRESCFSNKKKTQDINLICECHENYGRKAGRKDSYEKKTNDVESMTKDNLERKPCQDDHDDIASLVAKKYNGEILCIHNPPCILINGCLNLPPLKSNVPANDFPVTQIKNSSFSKMCRKIKRSKEKKSGIEQASQYHTPYAQLRLCLPEFNTEKLIQSICNHTPPCEIVRGCYRAKYNPKLANSCIHVPSCNKLPECLLDNTDVVTNYTCVHKPRCEELPLCSRKYVVLTAKEDVGTQIKPKAKMCRHEPPCFMIPRCLARAICNDYIPIGAIPGCVHQPSCEMIPACCRKSAKEMVSVPSQYPNKSCRIV